MSGPKKPLNPPPFKPIPTSQPNQHSIPTYNIPGGGQIHETFKIDRYGNLYDSHTTVEIPGGKKSHIPWKK